MIVIECSKGYTCVKEIQQHMICTHFVAVAVQEVCISLEVADPTSLPAAITKLLRVVATLPRLERFVADVCQVTPPLPALLCL